MLMPTSDNELIARYLAGDSPAAGELVKRYQSAVRQFLRRLSAGDYALADDIAQETFIRMLAGLNTFRGDASLGTWLHTVAYRIFLRQVASSSRLEFVDHEQIPEAMAVAPTAMNDILVEQMMKHLSLNERLAITLSFSAGMSHSEIADVTGMPLGTIKSHVNRAKKKLAALLNTEETAL